jgi:hypothetical protein
VLADEKNMSETVPLPLPFEQPEFIEPPAPPYRNSLAATLLFLSGLGLWGSAAIGAGAVLFGGAGSGAIHQLVDVFSVAAPAAAGGVVLLVIYTLIQQPWRKGRRTLAFALQVPFALFMVLVAGLFALDARRITAQNAQETTHQTRLAAAADVHTRP